MRIHWNVNLNFKEIHVKNLLMLGVWLMHGVWSSPVATASTWTVRDLEVQVSSAGTASSASWVRSDAWNSHLGDRLSTHVPLVHPCDRDGLPAPQSKSKRQASHWQIFSKMELGYRELVLKSWRMMDLHDSPHWRWGSPIFRPKSGWFPAAKGLTSSGHAIIQWIGMDWFKGKFTGNPIFNGKTHGFRLRFSRTNQPIELYHQFPLKMMAGNHEM